MQYVVVAGPRKTVLCKGVVNRGARGAKAPPVIQVLVPIFEKNIGDLAGSTLLCEAPPLRKSYLHPCCAVLFGFQIRPHAGPSTVYGVVSVVCESDANFYSMV